MGQMVFIEGLDSSVTGAQLTELLGQHGDIEGLELAKDEGESEGLLAAFVTMRSSKQGRAVVAALDGQEVAGHVVKVKLLKGHAGLGRGVSGVAPSAGGVRRGFGAPGGRGGAYGRKGRGKGGGRGS